MKTLIAALSCATIFGLNEQWNIQKTKTKQIEDEIKKLKMQNTELLLKKELKKLE